LDRARKKLGVLPTPPLPSFALLSSAGGGRAFVVEQAKLTGRWLLLYESKLRVARFWNVDL